MYCQQLQSCDVDVYTERKRWSQETAGAVLVATNKYNDLYWRVHMHSTDYVQCSMEGQDVEKEPLSKKPRLHKDQKVSDTLKNAEEVHTNISVASNPFSSRHSDGNVTMEISESHAEASVQHIREKDVGITHYISTHPGIFGILKQRFIHFITTSS